MSCDRLTCMFASHVAIEMLGRIASGNCNICWHIEKGNVPFLWACCQDPVVSQTYFSFYGVLCDIYDPTGQLIRKNFHASSSSCICSDSDLAALRASRLRWCCAALQPSLIDACAHTGRHPWADRNAISCTCLSSNGRWFSFDMSATLPHRSINLLSDNAKIQEVFVTIFLLNVKCVPSFFCRGHYAQAWHKRIQSSSSRRVIFFIITLFMRLGLVFLLCRVFLRRESNQTAIRALKIVTS